MSNLLDTSAITPSNSWDETDVWKEVYNKYSKTFNFNDMKKSCALIQYKSLVKDSLPFDVLLCPDFEEVVSYAIELLCTKCSYERDLLQVQRYINPDPEPIKFNWADDTSSPYEHYYPEEDIGVIEE